MKEAPYRKKAKRKLQAAKKQPENVDENGSRTVSVNDFLAERQQTELRKLKALQTNGNTNDGYAPKTAEHQPKGGSNQATEYDPQKITQKFHVNSPFPREIFFIISHMEGKINI